MGQQFVRHYHLARLHMGQTVVGPPAFRLQHPRHFPIEIAVQVVIGQQHLLRYPQCAVHITQRVFRFIVTVQVTGHVTRLHMKKPPGGGV